jgi:hypothetical protein
MLAKSTPALQASPSLPTAGRRRGTKAQVTKITKYRRLRGRPYEKKANGGINPPLRTQHKKASYQRFFMNANYNIYLTASFNFFPALNLGVLVAAI